MKKKNEQSLFHETFVDSDGTRMKRFRCINLRCVLDRKTNQCLTLPDGTVLAFRTLEDAREFVEHTNAEQILRREPSPAKTEHKSIEERAAKLRAYFAEKVKLTGRSGAATNEPPAQL